MSPRFPSSMRSARLIPRSAYFLAMLTTSLRLLRTSCSLAQGSFFSMTSLLSSHSCSQVSSEASSISLRYPFNVASKIMAYSSCPAEKSLDFSHQGEPNWNPSSLTTINRLEVFLPPMGAVLQPLVMYSSCVSVRCTCQFSC